MAGEPRPLEAEAVTTPEKTQRKQPRCPHPAPRLKEELGNGSKAASIVDA